MMVYDKILKDVLPAGYCLAFAYGSGVFKQIGQHNMKRNMVDFIVAVDDPCEWHRENIRKNPKHYSFLRFSGPYYVSKIQNLFGAKIYFNTLIPTDYGLIKYGVISKENLITDLLDWESLYVAGRLHKPVLMLHQDKNDKTLTNALKINLFSALHAALLMLPESFSEQQLYLTIAGISYSGDFRMLLAEDQNKVRNIVQAQIKEFRELYSPILRELEEYVLVDYSRGSVQQDTSFPTKFYHFSMLPKCLQYEIVKEWNKNGRTHDVEDVLRAAAVDPDSEDVVRTGIQQIVKISSFTQTVKGILTAGILKAAKYSIAKVKKMWESKTR